MKKIRARLEAMIAELRESPDVVLLHAELEGPARPGELDGLALKLGRDLPPEVRDLYETTNGFQIRWMAKKSPRLAERDRFVEGRVAWDRSLVDTFQNPREDGLAIFPPIAVVMEKDFSEEIEDAMGLELEGRTVNRLAIGDATFVFDWSSFYYRPALVAGTGRVVIADDHGIDWSGPHRAFSEYLDGLVRAYGVVGARCRKGELPSGLADVIKRVLG